MDLSRFWLKCLNYRNKLIYGIDLYIKWLGTIVQIESLLVETIYIP